MEYLRNILKKHKRLFMAWIFLDILVIFYHNGLIQFGVWQKKISGDKLTMPDTSWAFAITVPIGIVMFGIAIWAVRSKPYGITQV